MEIRICTFNIKFEAIEDNPHLWQKRLPLITSIVSTFNPHFFGTQEGRKPQLLELYSSFPNLNAVFNHRNWLDTRMYPSLFHTTDWSPLASGDLWLSETPHIAGSSAFDSQFPRLCTWAQLQSVSQQKNIFLVNVHLDHKLPMTREKQIAVLINEISKVKIIETPFILMGDFNEAPDGQVRKLLLEAWPELYDPWKRLGHPEIGSHHRFDGDISQTKRIDWILCSKHFKATSIEFDKRNFNGIWPSDHFPAMAKLTL